MRHFISFGILFLFTAVLASPGHAQPADDELGYVDPSVVEGWFDEPPTVEVNLRGALLRMAAQTSDEATSEDGPKVSSLLDRISGIYVRIYESKGQPMDALETRATELTERLGREGWETVVRVREPEEQVSIQTRQRDADTLAGMVVLVNAKDGESVFVNIVGDISPEELGQLTGSIDGLGGLDDIGDDDGGEDDQ